MTVNLLVLPSTNVLCSFRSSFTARQMKRRAALGVLAVLGTAFILSTWTFSWTVPVSNVHRHQPHQQLQIRDAKVETRGQVPLHPWHSEVQPGVSGILLHPGNGQAARPNQSEIFNTVFDRLCPSMQRPSAHPSTTFPDVLLIVEFVAPYMYEAIPFIELLYRRQFSDILYCGGDPETLKNFIVRHNIFFPVYYVHVLDYAWQIKYHCVEYAMKTACGNFTGYMLIGDDTLINVHMLQTLPRDKLIIGDAFLRKIPPIDTINIDGETWPWWSVAGGREAFLKVLQDLLYRAHHENDLLARDFLRTYYTCVNSSSAFLHMPVDFLYVPQRLAAIFLDMASLLRRHKANVELAMPFFACGLRHPRDVTFVKMQDLWGVDRGNPEFFVSPDTLYVHPFKFGSNFQRSKGKEFICRSYVLFS